MKNKWKLLTAMSLIFVFFISLVMIVNSQDQANAKIQDEAQLPVKVTQLPLENGVIPIELRCQDAQLSKPNKLEMVSCFAINNTNRDIISIVVDFNISHQINNKFSSLSGAITVETLINPDLFEERKHSFIKPKEEALVTLMPTTFDDDYLIKEVFMQIDYVEFDDKSTAGPNKTGAQTVSEIRDGASKYRNIITQKYKENGKSKDTIIGILENRELLTKEALGNLTAPQLQGAKVFQKFIKNVYEAKGREGVDRILK